MNKRVILLALILVLAVGLSGCASHTLAHTDAGSLGVADAGLQAAMNHGDASALTEVGHGSARGALFVLVGVLLVGAVIADVIMLPYGDPFCCCRSVIKICR